MLRVTKKWTPLNSIYKLKKPGTSGVVHIQVFRGGPFKQPGLEKAYRLDSEESLQCSCRCFCVELVKLLPMHRYSVDIFSYSGPSGILGSDRKQNTG